MFTHVRLGQPFDDIPKTRKKGLYEKPDNHGKITQRKFCMTCKKLYMDLGYGCQERSARAFDTLSIVQICVESYLVFVPSPPLKAPLLGH